GFEQQIVHDTQDLLVRLDQPAASKSLRICSVNCLGPWCGKRAHSHLRRRGEINALGLLQPCQLSTWRASKELVMNPSEMLSRQGRLLLQLGVALFLFTSFEGFV